MPRKMSKEKEIEFQELSMFLEYYSTNITKIDRNDHIHPSNVLVEIVEKFGKSKALQGLKQAINDTIEDSSELDETSLKRLDRELYENGIITLSKLRSRYWSKYKGILKRGKIRNETEYYLINGLLCAYDNGITQEEREYLSKLVSNFEEKP